MIKKNSKDKDKLKGKQESKGLSGNVEQLQGQVEQILNHLSDDSIKRVKSKNFKLPFNIKTGIKKAVKENKVLGILMKKNKTIEFKIVKIVDGLIKFGDYKYNLYEDDAVYTYNNLPCVVIREPRLLPIGGKVEEYRELMRIGSQEDRDLTNEVQNLNDTGLKTSILALQNAELDHKEKKPFNMKWLWIIGGLIAIFIAAKELGFL